MGSNIKGGGRAILSDEAEEALVSFLMSRSGQDIPNTEHARKREQKRFLKNLVERYVRNQLAKKFNKTAEDDDDDDDDDNHDDKPKTVSNKPSKSATPKKQQQSNGSSGGKVRIELVEAVYGKKGKPTAKKFKEGLKKLMVLPKSTSIAELMKQGQSKLRIKKKPVRCFVVENKIELDLVGDLSGASDGTIIYITTSSQEESSLVDENKTQKSNVEKTAKASAAKGDDEKIVEDEVVDMLDRVKQAYLQSSNKRRPPKKNGQKTKPPIQSHPEFSQHFDNLESLSEERSSLPAAACREMILEKVQQNRVVVICGATGCGECVCVCFDRRNIVVTGGRVCSYTILKPIVFCCCFCRKVDSSTTILVGRNES
jgi:HrpA-like RNA helicase